MLLSWQNFYHRVHVSLFISAFSLSFCFCCFCCFVWRRVLPSAWKTWLIGVLGWNEISGLEIITEPNETTISFTGSNQTFTWNFNLTLEEKSKQPTVIFAHWRKEGESISGYHWVTVIRESNGSESVKKYTEALITRRLQWVGDLARGFVAFQLLNVQLKDSSDYGIRFCIDRCRHLKESGFTLFVQVRNNFFSKKICNFLKEYSTVREMVICALDKLEEKNFVR